MRTPRMREETGLVGKLIVLWLVVAAVVALAAVDAVTIVVTRFRTADIARDAAAVGAATIAEGGGRRAAKRAVLAEIAGRDEDALPEEIRIADDGVVTVTVFDRAGTVLVGRFGLLEDLAQVRSTATGRPPTG